MLPVVHPPLELPWQAWQQWHPLPEPDAVGRYLAEQCDIAVTTWQIRQFSPASFAYRSDDNAITAVAKFYSRKTAAPNIRAYAQRECHATAQARAIISSSGVDVVRPLGAWRGVLLLEYVPSHTLQQLLAQASAHSEDLHALLTALAQSLAQLHTATRRPTAVNAADGPLGYMNKVLEQLAEWGHLDGRAARLGTLAQRYTAVDDTFWRHRPAQLHGDATAGNVLVTPQNSLTLIDWERSALGDAARDVGFLTAELTHSLPPDLSHGCISHFCTAYRRACGADDEDLSRRAGFYHALGLLRIARNDWLTPQERERLLARAEQALERLERAEKC